MNITDFFLKENGFETNHPEHALKKYYLHNTEGNEWRISIDSDYKPMSNKLGYKVSAWMCNENGAIVKRCQYSYIDSTEELQSVIDLCKIPLTLKQEF